MLKIDLHTHSTASPDGGITQRQYRDMLQSGSLNCVAVTDHHSIETALSLHRELGDGIIVGEEISTLEGDIIGLFMKEAVPPGLSAHDTTARIHGQGGLVYIPHPFERWRHSAGAQLLNILNGDIDILEIHNARVLGRSSNYRARVWGEVHGLPGAAGSDAHGFSGWGETYTTVAAMPSADTLPKLLRHAAYHIRRPSIRAVLYPNANRLRKLLRHG